MSVSYGGDSITFADGSTVAGGWAGFKNRIINGGMVIDQRNAGASGTALAYTVDRFGYFGTQASKGTWQQNAGSVTPPAGFKNYLGFTSSSSYTLLSADFFELYQSIEGYNIADLAWGTASAQTVTLSFWVRSSLTGQFTGFLTNSANTQIYPFTYTISTANTWEQKSITIAGSVTGTWLSTNGNGVQVAFSLGFGSSYNGTANAWNSSTLYSVAGSQSVVGTNGATFYITGVQLEKGSTATSFDYRPYGQELALCQRYYYQTWGFGAWANSGSGYVGQVLPAANNATTYGAGKFTVSMRATPTVTLYDSLGSSGTVSQPALGNGLSATAGNVSVEGFYNVTKSSTTFTVGTPVIAQFTASIEL